MKIIFQGFLLGLSASLIIVSGRLYLYGRTKIDYIAVMRYTEEAQYLAILALWALLLFLAIHFSGRKS